MSAIRSLDVCLRNAEDVHERYTSDYVPDDRSTRFQRRVLDESVSATPSGIVTPSSEHLHSSRPGRSESASRRPESYFASDEAEDDEEDIWPLELLDMHIIGYCERATKERDSEHFNQAEFNLNQAINYSEARERHYGVPFSARTKMQEDVAFLFLKQQKWGEAVSLVHQLLREKPAPTVASENDMVAEVAQARQNQLLAQIYFDRTLHSQGAALTHSTADVENAERHARRAFKKRFMLLTALKLPDDEVTRHDACIQLLIRILEARDKTVEASELAKLLSDGSSMTSDSIARTSTAVSRYTPDYDLVEDKYEILIDAIKSGDPDQIQAVLAEEDINIERISRDDKTPLMHAVERGDESTVHKLLDPKLGADVNTANKRGMTALHLAATRGLHEMLRCLLHHDADIDVRDRRKETPLMTAVKVGQPDVVQILSDRGADMLAMDVDEWSLLHHAIHLEDTTTSTVLLDLEPRLAEAVDNAGKTALHYVAELGYLAQTEALLEVSLKGDSLDVNY